MKIDDLHLHDIRGAVTRLTLPGCSVREIASILGLSRKDVADIFDAHDLGSKSELAQAAIGNKGIEKGGTKSANRSAD